MPLRPGRPARHDLDDPHVVRRRRLVGRRIASSSIAMRTSIRSSGSTGAIASPHSTIVTADSISSSKPKSCSSWIRSRRYTSTCATGTRPSYSCTIVNVGLVTRCVTPSPRARPLVKVVLPAPRSPLSTTRSPTRSSGAIAAPTASVSAAPFVVTSSSSCGRARGLRAWSARFTWTKSARDSASARPPERRTADGMQRRDRAPRCGRRA